ncbi:hypothetical protein M378DRAFT_165150 [Amanita muscaria Koide BX008]|uniref:Uncharacterized protein n=1 Tax=Amanita muscaria (strain Koide BX008) TaxID=946122 RepID=A0A0C2WMR0_AMAMK|nr:hypothetical protein M378DRAFT_165150 [Amanita muscaria Koide BX008]
MRFGVICAMSLLIAPTLVTSKSWSPPPQHSPPPPPSSPTLPAHGDLVRYQAVSGLFPEMAEDSPPAMHSMFLMLSRLPNLSGRGIPLSSLTGL